MGGEYRGKEGGGTLLSISGVGVEGGEKTVDASEVLREKGFEFMILYSAKIVS